MRALQREAAPRAESRQIELTSDDLRADRDRLGSRRAARRRRPRRCAASSRARVREEILYREALALGLDKDDTIVKRRLAQKMEFLFEDVAALREPTAEELAGLVREERGALRAAGARHVSPSLLLARPARRARARRRGARARRSSRASPMDCAGCDGARRSLHVPGLLLATARPTSVAKDVRPGLRPRALRARRRAPGGPDRVRLRLASRLGRLVDAGRVPAFEEVEPDVEDRLEDRAARRGLAQGVRRDAGEVRARAARPAGRSREPGRPRGSERRTMSRALRHSASRVAGVRIRRRRARGPPRLPRDQGDDAGPLHRSVAHAGALRHAPAGRAEAAGRCA